MDSFEIDNIKIEKANAIRRLNQIQNLRNLLFLSSELLLALFSISWLSKRTPDGLKITGDLFSGLVLLLERPMSCFLLVNLLVLVILVLPSRKLNSPDIYDEYTGSIRSTAVKNTTEEEKLTEEAVAENAAIEKETVTETVMVVVEERETVTETDGAFSGETVTELKDAVGTEVKRKGYRRSRSEIPENFGHKTRLELRRSGSAITGRTELPRNSVEDLSNEEFRLRIEKFIAEKKKTLFLETRESEF